MGFTPSIKPSTLFNQLEDKIERLTTQPPTEEEQETENNTEEFPKDSQHNDLTSPKPETLEVCGIEFKSVLDGSGAAFFELELTESGGGIYIGTIATAVNLSILFIIFINGT